MKKPIAILVAILTILSACASPTSSPSGGGGGSGGTGNPGGPTGGTQNLSGPVLAAFYDGSAVKLWDGTNYQTFKTGSAVHARGAGLNISVGSSLYSLTSAGAVLSTRSLPTATAKAITLQASSGPLSASVARDVSAGSGDSIWTFSPVTTEEMNAMGIYSGSWTHVYLNGVEQTITAQTFYRGTIDAAIVAGNGDVLGHDAQYGTYFDFSNSAYDGATGNIIVSAAEGGPFVVDDAEQWSIVDAGTVAGPFTISPSSVMTHALSTSTGWWKVGSVWFDTVGDSWDGTAFNAGSLPTSIKKNAVPVTWSALMSPPNSATPLLAYAGQVNGISYLIEVNSGWLISWDTVGGGWMAVVQLFQGNSDIGASLLNSISPVIVDGVLYFHRDGELWQTNLGTLTTSVFSADDPQMWVPTGS